MMPVLFMPSVESHIVVCFQTHVPLDKQAQKFEQVDEKHGWPGQLSNLLSLCTLNHCLGRCA